MDWDAWVHGPGMPPVWQDFRTPKLNQSLAIADGYIALAGKGSPANFTDYEGYYSSLKQIFVSRLQDRIGDVTLDILTQIDKDLSITSTVDPEVKQFWFFVCIMKGYQPVMQPAHTFISSMGRLKYLKPVYQALLNTNQKDLAVQWFNENINFYHPTAVITLKRLLGIPTEEEEHSETLFLTA